MAQLRSIEGTPGSGPTFSDLPFTTTLAQEVCNHVTLR